MLLLRVDLNIHVWKRTLGASKFVLDTLRFGYKISFVQVPASKIRDTGLGTK